MTLNWETRHTFKWFLAGFGFGALAGIFYAPRSGDETREDIKEGIEATSGYIKDQGRQIRETVSSWIDQGKEVAAQAKNVVS